MAGEPFLPLDDDGPDVVRRILAAVVLKLREIAATVTTVVSDLAAHLAAADPHPQYQLESEKGQPNGYASLDGSGHVPDAQIPAAIARDTEVAAAIAAHEAAADPHPQYALDADLAAYQLRSEKGVANGYPALGADGLVPQSQLGTGTQDGTRFLRDDGTWQPAVTTRWELLVDQEAGDLIWAGAAGTFDLIYVEIPA